MRRENPPGIPVSWVVTIGNIFGGLVDAYWQKRLTIWISVYGITTATRVVNGVSYQYYTSAQNWTAHLKAAKDAGCVEDGEHFCPEENGYGHPD